MALYFFKPVVWNDQDYQRPSGAQFISGYPAEHGFGHEEWNNSDRLEFSENGRRFRVFHTEGFGNQPLSRHGGRIFIFMIASFKGNQYLVSVAGETTNLFDNEQKRHRLADKLRLGDFWEDAWRLPSVQQAHRSEDEFHHFWTQQYEWLPTWICPAASYLPLKKPLLLDPENLTGRHKLISMYGSYQEIDKNVALRVLDLIPASEDQEVLSNLKMLCGNDSQNAHDDIVRIEEEVSHETTRRTLTDARLGQGKFRNDLLQLWNSRCAVTGCSIVEILRASHVKPWKPSTNRERLDPHNGLLLVAHLDALFDAGLISFDDQGSMLVSQRISQKDREELRLGGRLRKTPWEELKKYLAYHRLRVARDMTEQIPA
jgi:hypothetical protein